MKDCPKDGHPLEEKLVKGKTITHCQKCRGFWIPPSVVKAAVGKLPDLSYYATASIACPDDSSALVEIRHQEIEIDVCKMCGGVWLDRGEFEQILRKKPKSKNSGSAGDSAWTALDVFSAGEDIVRIGSAGVDIASIGFDAVGTAGEIAVDAASGVLVFIFGGLSGR